MVFDSVCYVYATCMLACCSCRLHFESDVTSQMRHILCVHVCVIDVLLSLCACQDGNTALIWAAEKGNTEIAVALVEKGAAMDVKDKVRWWMSAELLLRRRRSVCVCINH